MSHTEFDAREISLAAPPDGSRILLGYRDANLNTVTIALSADMVRRTLEGLLRCAASAGTPEMAAVVQTLSIREIRAQVEHGLATLDYELEAGIRMKQTIDSDTALALSTALSSVHPNQSAQKH